MNFPRFTAILCLLSVAAGAARSAESVSPPHPSTPSPLQGFSASLPRITPERFGAKGNGSADDAGAINKAFAFLKAAGGGTLSFQRGKTYLINSSVGSGRTDQFIDNVTVEGNGATIKNNGPSRPSTARFYTMRVLGSNVTVRNLTFTWKHHFDLHIDRFDPKGNGAGEVDALDVGGYTPHIKEHVRVENVKVYGAWFSGIRPRFASDVTVRNCTTEKTLATAIFPGNIVRDLFMRNNKIRESNDDAIFVGAAQTLSETRNVIISDNDIRDIPGGRAIGTSGVNGCLITRNAIDNTYVAAITVIQDGSFHLGRSLNVTVSDNTIRNAGRDFGPGRPRTRRSPIPFGIQVEGENNESITLKNNRIENAAGSAIVVANGKKISVTGNTIRGAGDNGIVLGLASAKDRSGLNGWSVESNQIDGVNGNGIYAVRCSQGSIRNNHIRSFGKKGGNVDRGIMAYNCDGVSLDSNEIINDKGAEEKLNFLGSKNIHQKPNTSSSNPR
jgi:hypothetical protein